MRFCFDTFFYRSKSNLAKICCYIMFGLFKKKSEKEKLEERYEQLLAEAYKLSTVNRTASDAKTAEANAVLQKIEALD